MSLRAKKFALSRDTSGTPDQLLHPLHWHDQEGRASLRVDGLLVENRNQAALITAPWREAKKGFLEKDQEKRKVAV